MSGHQSILYRTSYPAMLVALLAAVAVLGFSAAPSTVPAPPAIKQATGIDLLLAAHEVSPSLRAVAGRWTSQPVAVLDRRSSSKMRLLDLVARWQAIDMDDPRAAELVEAIGDEGHQDAFLENRFPSATECQTCHPDHFREWSVSSHAYAQLSPVFNAFQGTVVKLTNGTNGDFCIRCHTQVGMNLGEPTFMSNIDRHPTSREGISCIVCHRVDNAYSKISGRFAIVEGDIFEPVFGPTGGAEVRRVIADPEFSVNAQRGQAGRAIHRDAIEFDQIDESAFCGACHDVNLADGFRLEEAFSDYKSSPAAARGISCQDCHMGTEPGRPSGYATAPAAMVGGKPTTPRKRTNHYFAGPDYSIVHPGIFPHNVRAAELATIPEWLTFDWEAGWGTDEFEDNVPADMEFPPRWDTPDDRYEAREILDQNFELLEWATQQRLAVLREGYRLGEVVVDKADQDGIRFKVQVYNGTDGHSAPTGFDAERLSFLQVTVTDAAGNVVFVSGDRDPNGDVRDLHSSYVHNGELPLDKYLFSLQSKFITRMIRGGEREQLLAVNYSPSPLPFIRPDTRSTVLLARPVGARKHRKVLPPGVSKWPEYVVTSDQLRGHQGPFKANLKFIAQMVPVNILPEIQEVGFDYYMSPRDVAEGIVKGAHTLYDHDIELRPNVTYDLGELPHLSALE